jgi:carboxypeptidase Q
MTTNGSFGPDVVGHSVVAELTGTEFPNEYITVGGHLDSWDVNEGAHDDGAGIVQTIEIMRALKVLGYKPKRTLRFVLFANEENGMRGGNKYAEEAQEEQ